MANGKAINRKPPQPALPSSYMALIRQFPLRPITSDAELNRATTVMNGLLDRSDLDRAEEDYLDVLSDLVARYEDKHHAIPIDDLSDGEMLQHLIEAKDITQSAVARATAIAESTISEVLAGKRQLTRAQLGRVAEFFHVSADVFGAGGGRSKKERDANVS